MSGAMRRMGIYLGLVEDDDPRAYDRYDDQDAYGDGRRSYDGYDEPHGGRAPDAGRYGTDAGYQPEAGFATARGDRYGVSPDAPTGHVPPLGGQPLNEVAAAPEPEPFARRTPGAARSLGLAGAEAGAALRGGGSSGGGSSAVGLSGGARIGGTAAAATAFRVEAPEPDPVAKPSASYRIATVHPKSYNEARTIGERFREGAPVIMDLSEMDHADAKRLVDFAIGLIFGLHGSIERVTAKVFLLSPQDVDVTAEDKARIREGGFTSQS